MNLYFSPFQRAERGRLSQRGQHTKRTNHLRRDFDDIVPTFPTQRAQTTLGMGRGVHSAEVVDRVCCSVDHTQNWEVDPDHHATDCVSDHSYSNETLPGKLISFSQGFGQMSNVEPISKANS